MRVYVAELSDFAPGSQKSIRLGRQSVLVVNDQGTLFALRNLCTHESVALEGGQVSCGKITCSAHGATFDLATGAATAPAFKAVRLYRVVLEGTAVYVEEA